MEKQPKICFGFLGNGITAWTSCEGCSEPRFQAHISPKREITYYQENTPKYFIDAVEKQAQDNAIVGNYNNQFAFYPKNKPTKYCDTRYCGRILLCEEMCDGEKHICTTSGHIVDGWWSKIKDIDPSDRRPVYFVGNLKCNDHGQLCGQKFGFSFSKEAAEDAAEAIRNWKSPFWRNATVQEATQDDLIKGSVWCSLVNLDWEY